MKCWCGGGVEGDVCLESEAHDPHSTGEIALADVRRLYVAGPMSGLPQNNYPAFNAASVELQRKGYDVVNPAEVSIAGMKRVHYVDLLRADLKGLLQCDGVAVLPGWERSVGATNEVRNARLLKMPVRAVSDWISSSTDYTRAAV